MRILDLCSGTGAATRAFVERGHEVVTVDISTDLGQPDVQMDILDLAEMPGQLPGPWDFIWASPPCQQFSMRQARAKGKQPKGYSLHGEPDLSIMLACRDIIQALAPRWWVIENVREAVKYFKPHLGPASHWGAWYWWGDIPLLLIDPGKPTKGMSGIFASACGGKKWDGKFKTDRKLANGVHPSISSALCSAIESAE